MSDTALSPKQYYELLKNRLGNFDGSWPSLSGIPPSITDLAALTAGESGRLTSFAAFASSPAIPFLNVTDDWVPLTLSAGLALNPSGELSLDGDLISLAAATGTHVIYERSGANTWSPVRIGPGLYFKGDGTLSVLSNASQIEPPTDTKVSAATLDLTGLDRFVIDVTASNTISAITGLADEEEILLRFIDGLTLTQGASLQLLGGVDTIAPANSWGRFRRDGAVVTMLDFQTEGGYSDLTVNNLYVNPNGQITFSEEGGNFDIGRLDGGYGGSFLRFTVGDKPAFVKHDLSASVKLNTDLLTDIRIFSWPNRDITPAGIDGETLTNVKLGSLTTNGFVKVGSGDGTLSSVAAIDLSTDVTGNLQLENFDGGINADQNGWIWSTNGAFGYWRFITEAVGDEVRPETSLEPNGLVIGGSFGNPYVQTVAGLTTDGVSKLILGVNASTLGSIQLFGNTSGSATIRPAAIAGTPTITLPNASSTLPIFGFQITFAGPTAARTVTLPNSNFTVARTDAANTFTGVQTMTSPALTTPAITGLPTGSGVASGATASTLVARDANGDITTGNFISSTAGKGLQIKGGTNARAGEATLTAGTVTVTNSTVTNLSGGVGDIITLTRRASGGTIGTAITYTISNGTSFTINSDNPLDTSTFNYVITRIN